MLKWFTRLIMVLIILSLFHMVFLSKVYAYIVPGGASYIIQLIIGVLVGGLFAVKLFWNKIKIFFENLFSKSKKTRKNKEGKEG